MSQSVSLFYVAILSYQASGKIRYQSEIVEGKKSFGSGHVVGSTSGVCGISGWHMIILSNKPFE